jgi:hypothetical protein
LDLIGLAKSLVEHAQYIDDGRKGLDSDGDEHEGRLSYNLGIQGALQDFTQAGASKDCQIIAFAELTFMEPDLAHCSKDDTDTRASLTKGIHDFTDALACLEVVKKPKDYQIGSKLFPTYYKYRIDDCPWDAFQIACHAHKLRIRNILSSPGINMKEKAVLKQRSANMDIAKESYLALQKAALGKG